MDTPLRDSSGKFAGKASDKSRSVEPTTAAGTSTPPAVEPAPKVTPTEPPTQVLSPPSASVTPVAENIGASGSASDPEAPYGRRPDGTPRKKPGAKPGSSQRRYVMNPDAPDMTAGARALAAPKADDARFREVAEMLVVTSTGACDMVVGDPNIWKPMDEQERKFLIDATAQYLKAKGIPDLPPGWVLLGAVCMYVLPRITSQNFQMWAAQKIATLRG